MIPRPPRMLALLLAPVLAGAIVIACSDDNYDDDGTTDDSGSTDTKDTGATKDSGATTGDGGTTGSTGVTDDCDPACDDGEQCVDGTCVQVGAFRYTLRWSADVDLDLSLVDGDAVPVVDYGTDTSDACDLDVDSQTAGVENIFCTSADWVTTDVANSYHTVVHYYAGKATDVPYKLQLVDATGAVVWQADGTLAKPGTKDQYLLADQQ